MPADIVKAKNFDLTTDFPLDKVIYLNSGSLNIAASGTGSATIPHGLPFIPLTNLIWSTTPDFSISYMAGSGPAAVDPTLYQLGIDSAVNADATNNVVSFTNFFTSPVTIYYRLYAFEPSDSNADLPMTAQTGDTFTLNTDYNYTKLYMQGKLTLSGSTSIFHGLGYIPQIEVWIGTATTNYPPQQFINLLDTSSGTVIGNVGIYATATTLNFTGSVFGALYLHYKVYLDD